jgi:hypothetical protein
VIQFKGHDGIYRSVDNLFRLDGFEVIRFSIFSHRVTGTTNYIYDLLDAKTKKLYEGFKSILEAKIKAEELTFIDAGQDTVRRAPI